MQSRSIISTVRGLLAPAMAMIALVSAGWGTWRNLSVASAAGPKPADLTLSEPAPSLPISALPEFGKPDAVSAVSRKANPQTLFPQRSRVDVIRYTVQPGDSIFGIAREFRLKPETILWGNYEVLNDDPHLLRQGQELNILPVDGTYHQWQTGDSLRSVADFFGVEPEDILDWPGNGLGPMDTVIDPGTWVVVPGGKRALRQWVVPTIARGRAGVGAALGPGGCSGDYSGGAVGTGGFIWPSANHYTSGNEYWSGHLAIDIAAGLGDPVWASDTGVVVFAGWSTVGYGNMVMIDHGNGWQTLYAHLSDVSIRCGSSVGQGGRIGSTGSTGNSTGSHLHFEIRYEGGFVNPWYVLP